MLKLPEDFPKFYVDKESNTVGCQCGAISVTQAALTVMNLEERDALRQKISACETCKLDRARAL